MNVGQRFMQTKTAVIVPYAKWLGKTSKSFFQTYRIYVQTLFTSKIMYSRNTVHVIYKQKTNWNPSNCRLLEMYFLTSSVGTGN